MIESSQSKSILDDLRESCYSSVKKIKNEPDVSQKVTMGQSFLSKFIAGVQEASEVSETQLKERVGAIVLSSLGVEVAEDKHLYNLLAGYTRSASDIITLCSTMIDKGCAEETYDLLTEMRGGSFDTPAAYDLAHHYNSTIRDDFMKKVVNKLPEDVLDRLRSFTFPRGSEWIEDVYIF